MTIFIVNYLIFQSPDDFYDDEWDEDSEYGGPVTSNLPQTQYPVVGTKTTSITKPSGTTNDNIKIILKTR